MGDFSGFVHCLDAETGKLHWTHDMKAHMWGSTFVADGKLYVGDEDGDFVVLAATKEKKIISETNVGAAVYGTPIVANGAVYLQSNTHLFAFRRPDQSRRDQRRTAEAGYPVEEVSVRAEGMKSIGPLWFALIDRGLGAVMLVFDPSIVASD